LNFIQENKIWWYNLAANVFKCYFIA